MKYDQWQKTLLRMICEYTCLVWLPDSVKYLFPQFIAKIYTYEVQPIDNCLFISLAIVNNLCTTDQHSYKIILLMRVQLQVITPIITHKCSFDNLAHSN